MGVVNIEIATAEVEKYLDFKKKSEDKRDKNRASIDAFIDAVCEGDVLIKEDFSIIQTLRFPIEDKDGKPVIKTLEYKPRLKAETLQMHSQGIKSGDDYGRVNAHIAALTSNSKDLIKKMDTDDYAIASTITTVFFS